MCDKNQKKRLEIGGDIDTHRQVLAHIKKKKVARSSGKNGGTDVMMSGPLTCRNGRHASRTRVGRDALACSDHVLQ